MLRVDGLARAVRHGPGDEWVRRSARIGLAARGLVYSVAGALALQIAWNRPGSDREVSKDGALEAIADLRVGRMLVSLLAVGFAGYLVWRGTEALWGRDDEHEDGPAKATAKRAASAGKALVYLAVLANSIRIVVAGPDGTGGDESRAFTVRALELSWGRFVVGGVGVALLGAALYLLQQAVTRGFEDRLDTSDMGPVIGRLVDAVWMLGMSARGLIVGLVGFLLLKAALDFDPSDAVGVDGTLRLLAAQPYGRAMLTAVAIGIMAFALYSFAEARYRDL